MAEADVAIVRELYAHWERGDFGPEAAALLDPEVVYTRAAGGAGINGKWHGVDETWRACVEWLTAFEGLHIEAERFTDLGDGRVLVFDRHVAQGRDSGVGVDHGLGHIFTVRDGRVVRWDGYWERAEALQAAGCAERAG
jgi:2-(1,2-epoxy-1,2-dihydrophenyl)acetyl-CoA isomerase